MFDALARLADGHARRVGLIAVIFFLAAGAVGGGVADKLDPYGADDPDTETVQAEELLKQSGYRDTAVIVLFNDAPVGSAATRARVEKVSRDLRERHDVASVTGYYETRSRDFVSSERRLDLSRRRALADRGQAVAGRGKRDRRSSSRGARESRSAGRRSPRSR